jgi:hypothetical protein
MNDDTANTLAELIKSVGKEKAEVIVMTAYRLGFIDGQSTMTTVAQQMMQEALLA